MTNPYASPASSAEERQNASAELARRLQHYRNGLVFAALLGLLLGIVGVLAVTRGATSFADAGTRAQFASAALLIAVGCGLLAAVVLLVVAAVRRRPRQVGLELEWTEPPAARPFHDRMAHFLEAPTSPAVRSGADAEGPPRSFFALLAGPRRGPKSPSTIRAFLLRIQRGLRTGMGSDGLDGDVQQVVNQAQPDHIARAGDRSQDH
jgi:hypothetical protein